MRWLRARVRRFAGVWLVGQLALLVCVQTAMSAAGTAAVAITSDCGCAGATICPMHHSRTTSNSRTSDGCAFRGTSDPFGAVLASLLGPSAVVPPVSLPFVPSFARVTLTRTDGAAINGSHVPDPPPPRLQSRFEI